MTTLFCIGFLFAMFAAWKAGEASWRTKPAITAAKSPDDEKLLIAGMYEVNRYLAPYQTPESMWVDVSCKFCDAMRMHVTELELDAEGWTCVNGSTRCPDCSTGKEKKALPAVECGCASLGECCRICAPHWWGE